MPFWIDFCLIFQPKFPPKIHQNRSKIDAKMPSHVELVFGSIFCRILIPTWIPKSTQIQTKWGLDGVPILTSFLHRFLFDVYSEFRPPESEKSSPRCSESTIFQKSLFELDIDFWSILVPSCPYVGTKNCRKSDKIPIPRGIKFSIDFGIDVFWVLARFWWVWGGQVGKQNGAKIDAKRHRKNDGKKIGGGSGLGGLGFILSLIRWIPTGLGRLVCCWRVGAG